MEQEEYTKEAINWSYIEFVDNQDVLDLIEKVQYQSDLFLDKNKDYVVAEHQELLSASKCSFVACLFPPLPEETTKSSSKSSKFSSTGSRYSLKNSLLETVKEGDVRGKLEGLEGRKRCLITMKVFYTRIEGKPQRSLQTTATKEIFFSYGHEGAKLDAKFGFDGLGDLLTLFGLYLEFRNLIRKKSHELPSAASQYIKTRLLHVKHSVENCPPRAHPQKKKSMEFFNEEQKGNVGVALVQMRKMRLQSTFDKKTLVEVDAALTEDAPSKGEYPCRDKTLLLERTRPPRMLACRDDAPYKDEYPCRDKTLLLERTRPPRMLACREKKRLPRMIPLVEVDAPLIEDAPSKNDTLVDVDAPLIEQDAPCKEDAPSNDVNYLRKTSPL
ncbi:hypothetical protein AgCh_019862 [Apium graveolens]